MHPDYFIIVIDYLKFQEAFQIFGYLMQEKCFIIAMI